MDTDNLKALALAATPGPWKRQGNSAVLRTSSGEWVADTRTHKQDITQDVANADYIAEANPATVLELIAEVERLRADAERYRWLRDRPENPNDAVIDVAIWQDCEGTSLRGKELDRSIDATIEREKA